MHWFWRATIAMIPGCLYYLAFNYLLVIFPFLLVVQTSLVVPASAPAGSAVATTMAVAIDRTRVIALLIVPISLLTLATYHYLTQRYAKAFQPETRCRKCTYILRGITEPRCPECGEQI